MKQVVQCTDRYVWTLILDTMLVDLEHLEIVNLSNSYLVLSSICVFTQEKLHYELQVDSKILRVENNQTSCSPSYLLYVTK